MGPVLSLEVVLEPIATCIRVSTHDANYQARDGGLLSSIDRKADTVADADEEVGLGAWLC